VTAIRGERYQGTVLRGNSPLCAQSCRPAFACSTGVRVPATPVQRRRLTRCSRTRRGLTGTNRERPGLREALAACREGDTLVVTKLDRLARSLPDARAIADELTAGQVRLNLGGSVYDPTDPVGRLLFNVLAMVAEFESDLIRLGTKEGMKVAKAKGRLRGKQPKLNRRQEAHLVALLRGGEYSTAELADLFGVARSTVYRAVERERVRAIVGVGSTVG
jgi:DNA invertase Pin-like site-specific DNA recombinase